MFTNGWVINIGEQVDDLSRWIKHYPEGTKYKVNSDTAKFSIIFISKIIFVIFILFTYCTLGFYEKFNLNLKRLGYIA